MYLGHVTPAPTHPLACLSSFTNFGNVGWLCRASEPRPSKPTTSAMAESPAASHSSASFRSAAERCYCYCRASALSSEPDRYSGLSKSSPRRLLLAHGLQHHVHGVLPDGP